MTWTRLTVLLLIALLAMNVYRAVAQSVAIDEAFTYNLFLAGPVSDLFTKYDANHHILNSFLCRLSIGLLGLSEFSLRLPSLFGGLLYFLTIFWLCRRLFGQTWLLPFSFALLSMSPALLDYFSAARGYGLALAFLFLAIWQMVNYDKGSGRLEKAAACLALSVAANISVAFAGVPLATIFAIVLIKENRLNEVIDHFLVPGLVLAFSIMILPLTNAGPQHFYAGLPNLRLSVQSVLEISLFHDINGRDPRILTSLGLLGTWVIPVVLGLAMVACARLKPFRELASNDRVLLMATVSLAGSVALLAAAHRFFGILYPIRRTGIYWIPLLLLICFTLASKAPRVAAASCAVAGLVCLLQFVSQLTVHHYSEWPYDFDTKRAARKLAALHAANPTAEVTVGASWKVEPSLNFYRRRYRLFWMRPVERQASVPTADYYVLQGPDRALVESRGLMKVYENEAAELVVAAPKAWGR